MEQIAARLKKEFNLQDYQVNNVIALIDEGNTIPFIARYRKEKTGEMDDQLLRAFSERLTYLRALEERRGEVERLIGEQDKLTPELSGQIAAAQTLQELEDIYRPFRPKRRTRATIAREKGLEPLAELFMKQELYDGSVEELAQAYVSEEKGVETAEDALAGAMDILAEEISDDADFRKHIRAMTFRQGTVVSKAAKEEDSVYRLYYDFREPVNRIANHRVLAINRGEKEEFLKVSIEMDADAVTGYLNKQLIRSPRSLTAGYVEQAAADAYKRLIAPSLETELRNQLTDTAGEAAIVLFKANLKGLLLQPPIKGKVVLGLDPAYRTGCKIAVVDETGKVLDTTVIYCTLEHHDKNKAKQVMKQLIERHQVDVISIGNGTATKESEIFVAELLRELDREVKYAIVNESGASVYSASKLGAEEFPEFDVALRSAVSIARRLQDPLAELVKIDPKSIGVGQYQHDMNQKKLSEALGGVVEDCVNKVGVDLNTASASLLEYVSGVSKAIAKNIVAYREENGRFETRAQLLKVAKLGPKAYEQCAGFLRINDGKNPLDATGVHPESYEAAKQLLERLGFTTEDIKNRNLDGISKKVSDMKKLAAELNVGELTLQDIVKELEKPARDPREDMPKPILRSDVLEMKDLTPGMTLKGTVRNVIDFGAFVDIGVHQDGLVHISQMSDKFIKHPLEVVSVGDIVEVKVMSVDLKKQRIQLTMK